MLSMRDCLDYCDLTEAEVSLIADAEGIPDVMAAHVLCSLVQTDDGVHLLARWLSELIEHADAEGMPEQAARARAEFDHFSMAYHLPH